MPLIIKLPGESQTEKTIDSIVSNKDIYRTILDSAGIQMPGNVQGSSLLSFIRNEPDEYPDAVYTELDRKNRYWKSVCNDEWKPSNLHG